MSTVDSTSARRSVRAEASAWIARLHGPERSAEVEDGLRVWLAADPEHAQAFERVTEVWDAVGTLSSQEIPLNALRAPRYLAQAAAVAAVAVLLALAANWLKRGPTYVTDTGEQRIVTLEDGSRISLNSQTRMDIAYSGSQRRIVLLSGEAYFEVAASSQRPFIVVAGDRQVVALGTAFVVRHAADETVVALVDGKVNVVPLHGAAVARTLAPGERLVVSDHQRDRLDKPHMDAVTAWRRGEVILDETLMSDAVAEMNRYDKTQLVIDDPSVAALPVSGIYRTGDSTGFARAAARVYGLVVEDEPGQIHLRKAP